MPEGMRFDPTVAALIAEVLQAGDAVIVPARPVNVGGQERLGWWRVDPLTGTTSDMMDVGTASEMSETTVTMTLTQRATKCLIAAVPELFGLGWALLDGTASKASGVLAVLFTGFQKFSPSYANVVKACITGAV